MADAFSILANIFYGIIILTFIIVIAILIMGQTTKSQQKTQFKNNKATAKHGKTQRSCK